MRIDIATLFPDMCSAVLSESIVGRGIKNGYIEIYTHDIRPFTENRHNRVDDKPYGGGTGMVMQAQPIYDCIQDILKHHETRPRILYMSPQGETLTQAKVKELAALDGLIILCGHYEGVDQRVLDELGAEEISVGDYVLTGGELPALIVADAVARLQKGVLPNEDAYSIESHEGGLLEYPQYTRPEVWLGRAVPDVLLNGNHDAVAAWQHSAAIKVTEKKRPDMLEKYRREQLNDFLNAFFEKTGLPESTAVKACCRFSFFPAGELKLILRGNRRAAVLPEGGELPKRGEYSIVTNEDGTPRCVVKTIAVKRLSAGEITEEMAARAGAELPEDKNTPVIYEEFRLVFKR